MAGDRRPLCCCCGPRVAADWRIDVKTDEEGSLVIMCCTQCKGLMLSIYKPGEEIFLGETIVSVSVTAL